MDADETRSPDPLDELFREALLRTGDINTARRQVAMRIAQQRPQDGPVLDRFVEDVLFEEALAGLRTLHAIDRKMTMRVAYAITAHLQRRGYRPDRTSAPGPGRVATRWVKSEAPEP